MADEILKKPEDQPADENMDFDTAEAQAIEDQLSSADAGPDKFRDKFRDDFYEELAGQSEGANTDNELKFDSKSVDDEERAAM
jgi:hypothetical protein